MSSKIDGIVGKSYVPENSSTSSNLTQEHGYYVLTPASSGYGDVNLFGRSLEMALIARTAIDSASLQQIQKPSFTAGSSFSSDSHDNYQKSAYSSVPSDTNSFIAADCKNYQHIHQTAQTPHQQISHYNMLLQASKRNQTGNFAEIANVFPSSSYAWASTGLSGPIGPAIRSYDSQLELHNSSNCGMEPEIEAVTDNVKQIFAPSAVHDLRDWSNTAQKARLESVQRRARSQEKNRIAAMKSRQRKKKEWDRLIDAEKALRAENELLKQRNEYLENQLSIMIFRKPSPFVQKAFLRDIRKRAFGDSCNNSLSNLKTRNVAIIAHVDHGKTTLVDCMLQQCDSFNFSNKSVSRILDKNDLEKERGITILAKATSITWRDHTINIVDTPGHADFGGEVERALSMVDGVVLLVDATEGPMAQTKFVLSKALQRHLKPLVVFNKVDRSSSRCDEVDSELFDLFSSLGASEDQIDYPIIYASAKEGWSTLENPSTQTNVQKVQLTMKPLLDLIIEKIPSPQVGSCSGPFTMLVNSIESNQYVGRCYLGRIESGTCQVGTPIKALSPDGKTVDENRVTKIFVRKGIELFEIERATAGDIVTIAGVAKAKANYTICSMDVANPLDILPIDPPTVSMNFLVNDSPLAGTEGKALTVQGLLARLQKEAENNISIRLKIDDKNFQVSGRGEMQLGVIIETMRREGLEFAVSPPKVVCRRNPLVLGEILEPTEELTIDCPMEYYGIVIQKLAKRKGEVLKILESDERCRMVFRIPMRGLIGFSSEFKNDTHGVGVMSHSFDSYMPHKGSIERSRKGSLISMIEGTTTFFALSELESRGELFVVPGTKVYPGMVVGESSRSHDIEVNPCRLKVLTNVRSTVKEEFIRLSPARLFSLEETIAYMADDEIIEVTPRSIRLRKRELDSNLRKAKSKSFRGEIDILEEL